MEDAYEIPWDRGLSWLASKLGAMGYNWRGKGPCLFGARKRLKARGKLKEFGSHPRVKKALRGN